jgi:hypothetical protein
MQSSKPQDTAPAMFFQLMQADNSSPLQHRTALLVLLVRLAAEASCCSALALPGAPALLPAYEQAGRPQGGCKVNCCMEVSLTRCTLTKVCHCYCVCLAQLQHSRTTGTRAHTAFSRRECHRTYASKPHALRVALQATGASCSVIQGNRVWCTGPT